MWCGVKNTFEMSVYSKEYIFPTLLGVGEISRHDGDKYEDDCSAMLRRDDGGSKHF
jgi:hypothetical protein